MIKIFARNCKLIDLGLDRKRVRAFLETNHQQKWARGNIKVYGLVHDGELVQIMSFGKPRFNKKFQWEIIREASKKDVQIVGGASRLFKHFRQVNQPLSVIVYTSVKDSHLFDFTDHYVTHMGFSRIKESTLTRVGRWVSEEWPRKDSYGKAYAASSIAHLGPDRMLGTKFGKNLGTNSQIMENIGYKLEYVKEPSPIVDGWRAAGYLYRTDCSCEAFYVGMSRNTEPNHITNYIGSGTWLQNHLSSHKDHTTVKTILSIYHNLDELLDAEVALINNFIQDPQCLNVKDWRQGLQCPECRSFSVHKSYCKFYKGVKVCELCEGKTRHKKTCPLFIPSAICDECKGSSGNHKKICSSYKETQIRCKECNGYYFRHRKVCSEWVPPTRCDECGQGSHHARSCSKFSGKQRDDICIECKKNNNSHRRTCSKWKPMYCEECASKGALHKSFCSKYKPRTSCPECGGIGRKHRKACSQYAAVWCDECKTANKHSKECSKYSKRKSCTECAHLTHLKSCSHYKERPACDECGGKSFKHKLNCSLYISHTCTECQGRSNNHRKNCSKFKPRAKSDEAAIVI